MGKGPRRKGTRKNRLLELGREKKRGRRVERRQEGEGNQSEKGLRKGKTALE